MKKLFYVVEKQLEDIDGFEETTGWKTISVYEIKEKDLVRLCEIETPNSAISTESIAEWMEETRPKTHYTLQQL